MEIFETAYNPEYFKFRDSGFLKVAGGVSATQFKLLVFFPSIQEHTLEDIEVTLAKGLYPQE